MIENVKTDEDFLKVMYNLRCLPGFYAAYSYAPEAVITQGWGSHLDLANLAFDLLSRLGYEPRLRSVDVTEAGQENLDRIVGVKSDFVIPGLVYTDADGNEKIFVIPFMRDISELSGLVYLSESDNFAGSYGGGAADAQVTITVHAEIIEPRAAARRRRRLASSTRCSATPRRRMSPPMRISYSLTARFLSRR